MENEWYSFNEDYYQKERLDVLLDTGEIVSPCWPNAGKVMSMDGSGREWGHGAKVRKSTAPLFPKKDK